MRINKIGKIKMKILLTTYFLSGFCALIYQTVWIKKFSIIFGSTIFSMSIVLAVFFGGLSIGSLIFGRISTKSKNHINLYAVLQIFISIYAIMFPWILNMAEYVYSWFYPSIHNNYFFTVSLRAAIAIVVLIIPTIMMGGTLPLLAKSFLKELKSIGHKAGLIYGLNALGAALGCFMTGYIFLKYFGIAKTNMIAGSINFSFGIIALLVGKYIPDTNNIDYESNKESHLEYDFSEVATLTIICYTISGFIAISYEVIWLRYMVFFFRDTSYLYSGIITTFLFGIGAGSIVCGYILPRIKLPVSFLGFIQAGIGFFTILSIYIPNYYYITIYEFGENSSGSTLMLIFIMLIVPTFLMGASFPVVSKIVSPSIKTVGKRIGTAYALNTIGSIIGSLMAGFFFFPVLGFQYTMYILFGLNMLLGIVLTVSDQVNHKRKLACLLIALCVSLPIYIEYSKNILPEFILHQKISKGAHILEVREGITGTTWATKSEKDGIKLWDNSITISKGEKGSFLTQGYIPILIATEIPRNVLGLAFGAGLSYKASLLFPEIEHFDFVDISRENIEIALKYFPENKNLKNDSRVKFIIDDAYSFVKYSNKKYDLIFLEPTPPMFAFRTAALYTKEFYELAGERLEEYGYFVQVIPLGNMSGFETKSVIKTFSSVFKDSIFWWNERDCVIIGSKNKIMLNLKEINNRLSRPIIQNTLQKYSIKGKYNFIGNFISGFLLTAKSLNKLGIGGTLYLDDLPGLEYSTGRNISSANIKEIHANLTPWKEIKNRFIGFSDFDDYIRQFTIRREYFVALLYSDYPKDFYYHFLKYVEKYSLNKIDDLNLLSQYIIRHGMHDKAKEIQNLIEIYR